MMKSHLTFQVISLTIFFNLILSDAKPSQPISSFPVIAQVLNRTNQWRIEHHIKLEGTKLTLEASTVAAGIFCFLSAAISSSGGIGGGGLFIPIMTIVAGQDLKTASAFTAFMVTGVSVASVLYSLYASRISSKTLIDLDIALICLPSMLLGVSIGVICNVVFPEWLITVLFAIFLAWSTSKTCRKGTSYWRSESEMMRAREVASATSQRVDSVKQPLLGGEGNRREVQFPWMKLALLIMVWLSFFLLYLLRGNGEEQGIIPMKPCGTGYWGLSSFQILLAIFFTSWFMWSNNLQQNYHQDLEALRRNRSSSKLFFPVMALLAGILSGFFGIGGGMLISPLLLQIGIEPEVATATTSFMVFFSITMSSAQFLLSGMDQTEFALIFAAACFVASAIGLVVIQKAVKKYGRQSIIIFTVGVAMALSTVLMTSLGAIDVWNDYASGKDMGFKSPC